MPRAVPCGQLIAASGAAPTPLHPDLPNEARGWQEPCSLLKNSPVPDAHPLFSPSRTVFKARRPDSNLSVVLPSTFSTSCDDVSYTLGTENGQARLGAETIAIAYWRVTNIYRREEGEWKMVHHHTDVSHALVEVLKGWEEV